MSLGSKVSPAKNPPNAERASIEFQEGGWSQFERAIDAAVKSGPKHKTATTARATKIKQRPVKAKN